MEMSDYANMNEYYTRKDGSVRKRPINKRTHTSPRLDAEFAHFVSFLRDTLKGASDERIERTFDSYIKRLQTIKEFTIKRNHTKEGEQNER